MREPGNKRQRQRLETRQAILHGSLDLFVRRGFAATTVRDIAKAAGMSPGLMFHYFVSKDALLQEHVRVVAQGIDSASSILGSSKDPLKTFYSVAQTTLDSLREPYTRNLFLLANQVLSLESIPAAAKRLVSRSKSIEASAALIAIGQRKGEIRKGNPYALAVAFWGAIQGIAEILVWNPETPLPSANQIISLLET